MATTTSNPKADAMQAVNQLAFEVASLDRSDKADVMQIAVRELRPLLAAMTAEDRYQVVERMAEIIG